LSIKTTGTTALGDKMEMSGTANTWRTDNTNGMGVLMAKDVDGGSNNGELLL
jgi:hypothetical protein